MVRSSPNCLLCLPLWLLTYLPKLGWFALTARQFVGEMWNWTAVGFPWPLANFSRTWTWNVSHDQMWSRGGSHGFEQSPWHKVMQVSQVRMSLDWNEVSWLRESVDNDPNRRVSSLGFWKARYEIHVDVLPFPLWYGQRLQRAIRSSVHCFYLLTSETSFNICRHLFLHGFPPKVLS